MNKVPQLPKGLSMTTVTAKWNIISIGRGPAGIECYCREEKSKATTTFSIGNYTQNGRDFIELVAAGRIIKATLEILP